MVAEFAALGLDQFTKIVEQFIIALADDLYQRHAAAIQIQVVFSEESGKPSCRLLPASSSR